MPESRDHDHRDTASPDLEAGVEVWTAFVSGVDVTEGAAARCLSDDEIARVARFRSPEDRASFVAAHRLLRAALGARVGADPRTLRFEAHDGGKPTLSGRRGPEFNLSHTRGVVTVAVAGLHPVGVDIERVRTDAVARELEARVLHPDELARLRDDDGPARAFFRIWALKEAYIKATGEGLAAPLREICFAADRPALEALPRGRDRGRWSLDHRYLDGAPGAVSQAVCWAGCAPVRWRTQEETRALLSGVDHR
ncbi:MAG: 4'-phosphopantetheinyl transferase superfamily protein [Planctomycetota bacterium]